jgi:hypothetical protein
MSAKPEIASCKTGGVGGVVGEFAEVGVGLGSGGLDIALDTWFFLILGLGWC